MTVGNTIFNIFIEPQFTMLHKGLGQPAFQVYTALNMQFKQVADNACSVILFPV